MALSVTILITNTNSFMFFVLLGHFLFKRECKSTTPEQCNVL